jgi:PAS domain S-box-containing protein
MVWFPSLGWSMRLRQIAPVALVLGLTVAGFFGTSLLGERGARTSSEHRAEVAAAQIRGRVEQGSYLAEGLRRLMESLAGYQFPSAEFQSNASRWLIPAGFSAAAWVEQVAASQRAAYERRTGNPIVIQDQQLSIVPAGARASYLPATFVSGVPPTEVPGTDLGGEPGLAVAVTRASAVYAVVATPLATLQDGTNGFFLVKYAPYSIGPAAEPGFVVLFVTTDLLRAAATGTTTPLQITVGASSTGDLGGAAAVRETFTEAGQRFGVAVPLESVQGAAAVLPWIILAAGLALAALISALGVNTARRARAQNELDRIFNLSSDLIAVADFEGHFTRVNPAVEQILGYTAEEFLARPYLELVHPDDREKTIAAAARIRQGQTVASFEARYARKDGSYRVLEWTSTPVLDQRLTYAVARDVTERRQAESELRRVAGEQAARRRVATLVARGAPPTEVFSAVAEEVKGLLDAQATAIGRLDPDRTMVIVASSGTAREVLPLGSRLTLESDSALTMVARTGRPVRFDDDSRAAESPERMMQRLGVRCTVAVPIMVGGSLWGSIAAGTSRERFPADAEQHMAEFTELVATAIANADSRSQLAASRRRIVTASDQTRRRIERDLHDGTQQRLVSLVLGMRTAATDVPPGQDDLRAELSRIAAGLTDAVAELREISRGIHPAILSQGGLGPALRTLARRSTIPVDLHVTTDMRLPEPVEVAVYYVVSEALANAAKHAQASAIEVSLATGNGGSVLLSIRDNGAGGADPGRGSGLVGLQDRIEALGGTIRIDSPPGGGTSILVTLPLDVESTGIGTSGATA